MLLLIAALCSTVACGTAILSPQFVNRTAGTLFPVAPGGTDLVLVQVENQTDKSVTFILTVEDTRGPQRLELDTSESLPSQAAVFKCPVSRVGLGELGDLNSSGIRIINPVTQRFFEQPWGRNALTEGRSFLCGDTIVFLATQNNTLPGSVEITVGRIDGGTQTGPFVFDTFQNLANVVIVPPE